MCINLFRANMEEQTLAHTDNSKARLRLAAGQAGSATPPGAIAMPAVPLRHQQVMPLPHSAS